MGVDIISLTSRDRIKTLYPGIRPLAFRILQDCYTVFNRAVNVTEAMRSMNDQFHLYMKGREIKDGVWRVVDLSQIVTNARPGLSFHNYGLAFDIAFSGLDPYLETLSHEEQDQHWQKFGDIVKGYGMHWGGEFRLKNGALDKPHAELSYGLQIHECQELYDRGGLTAVWMHINQIRGLPDEGIG